jgi:hypothetical protein
MMVRGPNREISSVRQLNWYQVESLEPENHQRHRTGDARGSHRLQQASYGSPRPAAGIFVIDPESFEVLGKWEIKRGPHNWLNSSGSGGFQPPLAKSKAHACFAVAVSN